MERQKTKLFLNFNLIVYQPTLYKYSTIIQTYFAVYPHLQLQSSFPTSRQAKLIKASRKYQNRSSGIKIEAARDAEGDEEKEDCWSNVAVKNILESCCSNYGLMAGPPLQHIYLSSGASILQFFVRIIEIEIVLKAKSFKKK